MTWENTTEADRPQVTIWHIRIKFRIPKATNTRSEYVTLIAFTLRQCLSERASMMKLYVRCLSGSVQWDSQTYMFSQQMSERFTVTAELKELGGLNIKHATRGTQKAHQSISYCSLTGVVAIVECGLA